MELGPRAEPQRPDAERHGQGRSVQRSSVRAARQLRQRAGRGRAQRAEGRPDSGCWMSSRESPRTPGLELAFAMVILAYLACMMFVGYLCSRVRDGGWLATTALVGGIAAITVNLAATSVGLPSSSFATSSHRRSPAPCKISMESDTCCCVLPCRSVRALRFGSGTGDQRARTGTELGRHRNRRHLHRRDRRNRPALRTKTSSSGRSCWSCCGWRCISLRLGFARNRDSRHSPSPQRLRADAESRRRTLSCPRRGGSIADELNPVCIDTRKFFTSRGLSIHYPCE